MRVDRLLTTGGLTGRDLVHEAAPAARILSYLNAARRRGDAPAEIRAAVDEVAALVGDRLGTDPAAWGRVTARLTERDPDRDPVCPVSCLMEP
ncbi:hypothetical protein AB0I68_25680 [Streptomyces sp. NPDC050448]|uniref:hypothetical protein n=1 Tax=Streptomyces sp. NPDC050448 TaxID=3155404 RepID=UPI00343F404C